MAHKKGVGSSRNGRNSPGQRYGLKRAGGQMVKAGQIIYRQCGTHIHPGAGVGIGRDCTLYALKDGRLSFAREGKTKKKAVVW